MSFEGKVVVVTGATSGIGRAIARAFADDGATVVVGDRREEPERYDLTTVEAIEESGGRAHFFDLDVSRESSVSEFFEAVVDRFGQVDILVNNAGILRLGSVEDIDPSDWDRTFEVNVRGVYLCSRHAVPHLRDAESPRIINLSSQLGLVGTPESSAYCASKAAVANLTREMALDYAEDGITVNALNPGPVKTRMTEALFEDPEVRRQLESNVAVPFMGEPEDVAHAALFLASPRSRYVTGHCLTVDGGWTAH